MFKLEKYGNLHSAAVRLMRVQKRLAATAGPESGYAASAGNPGDFTGTGQAIAATGVGIGTFNQSDNSQVKLYNDCLYTINAEGKAE